MIKKIMIENFLSIGVDTFIFEPSDNINVIYGENGAGKTNFIAALCMLKNFIIKGGLLYDAQNKFISEVPTKIYLEAIIDENTCFQYFLQYSNDSNGKLEIEQEELSVNETTLLNRASCTYGISLIEEQMLKKDKMITHKSVINKNVLEIDNEDTELAQKLQKVYDWFSRQFISLQRFSEDEFGEKFSKNQELKSFFLKRLEEMNIPIFDVIVEKNNARYEVSFLHSNGVKIGYSMESKGKKKIVSNLLNLSLAVQKNIQIVFIEDEFDTSIHYELSNFLVQYMRKQKNIQFIGATHNLIFLEQQKLGKKAFWFVEKNAEECTTIFSLNDIEGIRSDNRHNWRKMYREHRFGAYLRLNLE